MGLPLARVQVVGEHTGHIAGPAAAFIQGNGIGIAIGLAGQAFVAAREFLCHAVDHAAFNPSGLRIACPPFEGDDR